MQRASRGEAIKDAREWAAEMAVIRGSDEPEGLEAPCPGYDPGDWKTVQTDHGTSAAVRLCRHCGDMAGDHPEPPEPSDSQRRTIVPGAPDDPQDEPTWPTALTPAQAADDVIEALMGPVETWFERLCAGVSKSLGRAPNVHEVRALRAYVCGAAIGLLADAVRR